MSLGNRKKSDGANLNHAGGSVWPRQAAPERAGEAGEFGDPFLSAPDIGYGLEPETEPGEAFRFDEPLSWAAPLPEAALRRWGPEAEGRAGKAPERQGRPSGPFPDGGGHGVRKSGAARPVQGGAASKGIWRSVGRPSVPEAEPKGHPFLYVGVISVCTLLLAVIVVMMMPQLTGYFWKDIGNFTFINGETLRYDPKIAQTYKQYRDYLQQDVIYPGVFVDGVHVGEMTIGEARDALSGARASQGGGLFSVTVAIGNRTWIFDSGNVPAVRDVGLATEQAYAVGRTNSTVTIGTKQTPFRERVDAVLAMREKGVNLTAAASYDKEAVRGLIGEIEAYVTRQPIDAQIESFNFATRAFSFTDEQLGVTIDSEALYDKVTASLDRLEKGVTLNVDPVLTQPAVTKAELTAGFKMVAAYTTDTTGDSNRNNNIALACQAINGTALMPGETFSFNGATGQRTIGKGYREAGAISAGQSIEEVGGGICQVSSTLFNAVARADLEIVRRSPHAWPSTYVNRGEDATVNWPNLDFTFRNSQSTPVFVIAYYQDRKCSAEIWGYSLGEGVTIDLKSNIVKTMEPPPDTRYVVNSGMAPGASKETVKPRTGYVVDTYKVWYQNGQEIKREKMHTSTYKAYQRTIEYN
ncbi:MAG: VanW family protein [Clostridia bacterium]|nr:VanW family protein [Clostridia bacterium]